MASTWRRQPSHQDSGTEKVPVIALEHVTKRFVVQHDRPRSFQELMVNWFRRDGRREELVALDDVSLQVWPGETIGVIGPNGSGKSTLLKLITRILEPSSGQVQVCGRVSALLELGAGFHPDLTGRENVYLNASLLGYSRREMDRQYESIVHFAELERFMDMPVKHYSSGMYMRLGFAIAIHVDPDILLIDEVLAVGDRAFQQKCLDRIQRFRRDDKAILFVSHDLSAITTLCNRVIWLDDGRIMGQGRPREMVDKYVLHVWEKENALRAARQVPQRGQVTQAPPPGPDAAQASPGQATSTRRWGTREVEVTDVQMLNQYGQPAFVFESGEPVVIEIHYRCNRLAQAPVFGIGILRNDGLWCYGSNTHIESLPLDNLDESGVVRVEFDRFAFIEGEYSLDVAVHTVDGHPYDYRRGCWSFAMRSRLKDIGVYRPDHRWCVGGQTMTGNAGGGDDGG